MLALLLASIAGTANAVQAEIGLEFTGTSFNESLHIPPDPMGAVGRSHIVELVNGRHDVFGDGRVVCVPTPGHTVGHQALRVQLDSGPIMLTGDCVYFERMLTVMIVPPFGTDGSQERQKESMRELARLRDEEGCRLLFGHDEAQVRSLPAAGLE